MPAIIAWVRLVLVDIFSQFFDVFLKTLFEKLLNTSQSVVRFIASPLGICASVFITIVCVAYQSVINPKGAINTFMIHAIDTVLAFFPSTPDNLKIGSMISGFYAAIPSPIGASLVHEIMVGVFALLPLFLAVKLYKMMPFI
jgi:hypothetical protein